MKYTSQQIKENALYNADMMAAAATTFDKGGYDVFISARENFKVALEEMLNELNKEDNRQTIN